MFLSWTLFCRLHMENFHCIIIICFHMFFRILTWRIDYIYVPNKPTTVFQFQAIQKLLGYSFCWLGDVCINLLILPTKVISRLYFWILWIKSWPYCPLRIWNHNSITQSPLYFPANTASSSYLFTGVTERRVCS